MLTLVAPEQAHGSAHRRLPPALAPRSVADDANAVTPQLAVPGVDADGRDADAMQHLTDRRTVAMFRWEVEQFRFTPPDERTHRE